MCPHSRFIHHDRESAAFSPPLAYPLGGFRTADAAPRRGKEQEATLSNPTLPAFSRAAGPAKALGLLVCVALGGCNATERMVSGSTVDPKYGVSASPRVVGENDPVPKGGGYYKLGKPYTIAGRTYVPKDEPNYVAEGQASWYGRGFHGRKTANGEIFDMTSISAAHKTLPMPSYVRVTNLSNKRSIIVRVNNRGPYVGDRLIDLSYRTAELLGFAANGVAKVRVEYVGRAPVEGSDDKRLAMTLRQDGTPATAPDGSGVMVASSKPLVPEVAPVMAYQQEAPLPPSRPYDLGEAPAAPGSRVTVASVGWSSGPQPVGGMGFAGVPGR